MWSFNMELNGRSGKKKKRVLWDAGSISFVWSLEVDWGIRGGVEIRLG